MIQKNSENGKHILLTKGKFDYVILIVTILLTCLGIIMVLSASAPSSLSESGNSYKYVIKQAIAAGVGCLAMFFFANFDYHFYRKLKWPIYVLVNGLLLYTALNGMDENGAKRWLNIAGINFQPSEVAKVGYILFFSSYLMDIKEKSNIRNILHGCIKPLIALVPVIYIVYHMQNHLSATFIICAVSIFQMFVAGTRLTHILLVGGIAGISLLGGLKIKDIIQNKGTGTTSQGFRSTRLQTWLDPFSDPTGAGWQIINSLYAIGSGGLFGLGLGNSKQKYLYLPEPHNDFIFSVLAEELGFVGCLAVITLFVIFIWRGITIAIKSKDLFGTLIATGIVAMIGLEALINIAVVTGTMPVTGMQLPFFSYGGTAIAVNLGVVGILLNISKKRE